MITAEGGIEREYIRVAPSTGAAAPGPGGLTARLLRMSKQTRSQTTKHGEPELSAPAIGGEDAAHTTCMVKPYQTVCGILDAFGARIPGMVARSRGVNGGSAATGMTVPQVGQLENGVLAR